MESPSITACLGGEVHQKVFYDEKEATDENEYNVVCDACVIDDPECYHHDIISYHGNHEYCVRAKQDENGKWFILIRFFNDNAQIVVEDGKWYFVQGKHVPTYMFQKAARLALSLAAFV